ncbi:MAG: hypothetical protein EPO51_08645 [Phenylobacterium sp.]|uniref:hypothetical protein n=1 Tax=Phenylobacterium sp. TaxID=1871053 RepID=UPI0011F76964|nr:hypothetical protein [Phenylobacterium sp.]TAJ72173.1 MAG: hypothetical protein EPO51_08645 [Phenylobacterium sp.]
MDFAYENPELEAAIGRAGNVDDLERALRALSELVPTFMQPDVRGWKTFCPGLDKQVADLPRRLKLQDVFIEKSNDNVCIVATRFYGTGGHSKVASDIGRLIGREPTTIVLTDLYRQLSQKMLISGLPAAHSCRALALLSAPTMVEKIVELYMLLAAIRPSRIFLMQNHMDPVAVAGVWPFRSVVEFLHHADHQPGLGATLPFSSHVDLTYACHRACQSAGLDPVWAGMTVLAEGIAPPPPAPRPVRSLRFATCGSKHKYMHPANHAWSAFAAAALGSAPDSTIIHIGPVDEALTRSVHDPLLAAGIDPARYRFAGPAPDLREALIEEEIDVYLASYPDSGGRANLEALAAGLAPIVPTAAEAGPLLHFDMALPYWVRINTPDEMPAAIARSFELSSALRSPDGQAALHAEFSRFEDYVRSGVPT